MGNALLHQVPSDHVEANAVAEYMILCPMCRNVDSVFSNCDDQFDFRIVLLGGGRIGKS